MKIGRELRELLEKSPDSDARLTLRERRCLELLERVEKADAEAVARNLGIIQVAARTSWQAAAWFLERTKPGEYSRKSVFTVEQSDVSSIKTPAEIAAAMDETVGAPPAQ